MSVPFPKELLTSGNIEKIKEGVHLIDTTLSKQPQGFFHKVPLLNKIEQQVYKAVKPVAGKSHGDFSRHAIDYTMGKVKKDIAYHEGPIREYTEVLSDIEKHKEHIINTRTTSPRSGNVEYTGDYTQFSPRVEKAKASMNTQAPRSPIKGKEHEPNPVYIPRWLPSMEDTVNVTNTHKQHPVLLEATNPASAREEASELMPRNIESHTNNLLADPTYTLTDLDKHSDQELYKKYMTRASIATGAGLGASVLGGGLLVRKFMTKAKPVVTAPARQLINPYVAGAGLGSAGLAGYLLNKRNKDSL